MSESDDQGERVAPGLIAKGQDIWNYNHARWMTVVDYEDGPVEVRTVGSDGSITGRREEGRYFFGTGHSHGDPEDRVNCAMSDTVVRRKA